MSRSLRSLANSLYIFLKNLKKTVELNCSVDRVRKRDSHPTSLLSFGLYSSLYNDVDVSSSNGVDLVEVSIFIKRRGWNGQTIWLIKIYLSWPPCLQTLFVAFTMC